MSNFTMPNNTSLFKMGWGVADVGIPHGDGDGYRTSAKCREGVRKKFQMTNFTKHNNIYSTKYALKPVPGLADVGVPNDVPSSDRCMGRLDRAARTKINKFQQFIVGKR